MVDNISDSVITVCKFLGKYQADNLRTVKAETFGNLIVTEDAKEGISAFLEKRKAGFRVE